MTYVFDGALGTLRRGSRSFGPSFAERALTIGRRKLNAGFNYQRTTYRQFEGQNLTRRLRQVLSTPSGLLRRGHYPADLRVFR